MANVNFKFPLFNLPPNAHKNVLRTMIPKDLIKYSLCSKCNKDRVRSLGITLFNLKAIITSPININIFFTRNSQVTIFFKLPDNRGQRAILYPDTVHLGRLNAPDDDTMENSNYQLTIRQWIEYFMDIFHRPKFDHITFLDDRFDFDIDVLVKTFKNIKCDTLASLINIGHFSRLARTVFPHLDNYQFHSLENATHKAKHGILMQNANTVTVPWTPNPRGVITFNDLLISNVKHFNQEGAGISDKELNRFLKLWRTGSNPKLVFLELQFDRRIDANEILRGINTQMMNPDDVRQQGEIRVENAILMYRRDGDQATLRIASQDNNSFFEFVVWT